ncbi:hypothetical protein [Streptomyces sp. NPDC046821]|uniref:hypothetical protein n=1 Tax=Streptomyces sp. NPDC046821 TaxID=3154702 RepID=UPI003400F584
MTTITTLTFTHGATAATDSEHPHRLGNALRAAKVMLESALRVVLLGEYDEEAGVSRRPPGPRTTDKPPGTPTKTRPGPDR